MGIRPADLSITHLYYFITVSKNGIPASFFLTGVKKHADGSATLKGNLAGNVLVMDVDPGVVVFVHNDGANR